MVAESESGNGFCLVSINVKFEHLIEMIEIRELDDNLFRVDCKIV